MVGAGLLRGSSFNTAKVPVTGEDASNGELAGELFVLALYTDD